MRKGNVLVLVATGVTALVLFGGLAVDVGFWYARKSSAQAVLDVAALSAIGGWDDASGTTGTFDTEKTVVENLVRQTLSSNGLDPNRFTTVVTRSATRDDPETVTVDGTIDVPAFFGAIVGRTLISMRVRAVASASVLVSPPTPCSIVGINFVDIGGGGTSSLDSFDSTVGAYSPVNTLAGNAKTFDRANVHVCSNGEITYNGNISQFGGGNAIDDIRVNGGSAFISGKLKSGDEIRTNGSSTVLGGTVAPTTVDPVNLPAAVLPTNIQTQNDNGLITGDFDAAALTDKSHPRLTTKGTPGASGKTIFIPAGGTYYFENVEILSSNSRIQITGDPALAGKTRFFVNGGFTANGGIIHSATGATARDLLITATGSNSGPKSDLTIGGNVTVVADIYAPAQNVIINGNATFRGRVQALSVKLNGNADFTFDESLGVSAGQSSATVLRPHLTE